ncbi:MAG TPA: RagB/SusD family nutrient uptake outer membrane protein [Bacteroidales bacterium]|nr:RagB/SusD family nutrient uptake outer membrane protein [Bacteroidales bacterium]
MKRTYIYIVTIALLTLAACESMELKQEVRTSLTEEQVMKRYEYTMQHGLRAYNFLQPGFLYIDGAMSASASDDAEHTLETSDIQKFNNGSWNPLDNPDNAWANYFAGIRNVNKFLSMSDSVELDYLRLDPNASQQALYKTYTQELKNAKYENRFLRAYFYFELIKRYGGVPILTDVLSLDADLKQINRNSLQECVTFIVSELDSAAAKLPKKTINTNLGKITAGAAMALKSRVLLYAASDLYNNPSWAGSYANKELISLSGDRTARWQSAANAAKAVIDISSEAGYSLAANYRALFQTYNSPEIIFTHRAGASNSFEKASYPIGFDKANSGTTPSQNLVDEYEVKIDANNAVAFDWNNPAHAADPYASRDPRLDMSVVVNNSKFKDRAVEIWEGGKDGAGKPLATRTGYYLRKYVDETLDLLQEKTSVHSWIYIRLAEVYLNYAEALNECQPGNPDIKKYVDLVRQRASMPPIAAGLSQAEMRDKIRHERRVELAFEGQREWDLRRWMQAESRMNAPLKGVSIRKLNAGFAYQPVTVESRVFTPKMYFYPIPQSELNIQTNWEQNPLW